jgi:hypothetical protein
MWKIALLILIALVVVGLIALVGGNAGFQ